MDLPVNEHTFNRHVNAQLCDCLDLSNGRGGEYADTWALDNQQTAFLDATLKRFGVTLEPEQKRLVLLASLIDVKDSRMLGGWKPDTVLDGINYRAAYAGLRSEYEADRAAESTT